MLETEYKKESDGKTYLFLEKRREAFEEQMIQRVKPKGVLPMVRSEQTDCYKYEITGKKTLTMTFERIPMNAEQIEAILHGILDVLEKGREYLLSEDNFILSPEYIYVHIPEYEVTLCYYPEYKIPFAEQMGKLFEMLLNRVDYREEKAIAMVYALYMQLQEPDMTLERIREKLQEQASSPEGERILRKGIPENREESLYLREMQGSEKEPEIRRIDRNEKAETKKIGLWERVRKEVGAKIIKKNEKQELLPQKPSVLCVNETAMEWGTQYTRVLSTRKTESQPILVSQRNGATIFLPKFPFYIGSLPEYMDYVIERDTVSRFHAKVIKQEGNYFLVDLNSTNGTQRNGQTLNVQEQERLNDGDRIVFADDEYIFYEKQR